MTFFECTLRVGFSRCVSVNEIQVCLQLGWDTFYDQSIALRRTQRQSNNSQSSYVDKQYPEAQRIHNLVTYLLAPPV